MAKLQVFDIHGNKEKEITTDIFEGDIRPDIVQKITELERVHEKQPYAPYLWAGMDISASGNVKHNRHTWKTDRGKGLGRFPKKRMSDKGERFQWVGAVVPGMRGGRRAHPPRVIRTGYKINRKEKMLGLKSALAMVASLEFIKKKYTTISDQDLKIKLPLIIDSKITSVKAKEFFATIEKIFGDLKPLAIKEKKVRNGVGKLRGRKYKSNAGMILVIGNNQSMKISGIDVINVKALKLKHLAENGARFAMFTEAAIKDLEARIAGQPSKEDNKGVKTK
jgi:large subunit ribosomal protein L4e